MKLNDEWFQTPKLLGLPDMPSTIAGINYKAKNENWIKRKPEGVKGRAFEYHIDSFPLATQQALRGQVITSRTADIAGIPETALELYKALGEENAQMLLSQLRAKGINGVVLPAKVERLVTLALALTDDDLKEILALAAEAQYCDLAGLPFKPANQKNKDVVKRKAG